MAKKTIEQHGAADFDWDALALDGYSHIQRSELSDKYEQTLTSINEKEVVEGTVVLVTKKRSYYQHRFQIRRCCCCF